MHPVSCTNTYPDITDLVNRRMVKDTKTGISQEQMVHFEKLLFGNGGNF